MAKRSARRLSEFVEPALWVVILVAGVAVFWRPTIDLMLRGDFSVTTAIVLAVAVGLVIRIAWRLMPRRSVWRPDC